MDELECQRFENHLELVRAGLATPEQIKIIKENNEAFKSNILDLVRGQDWPQIQSQVNQSLDKIGSSQVLTPFDLKVQKLMTEQRDLIEKIRKTLKDPSF